MTDREGSDQVGVAEELLDHAAKLAVELAKFADERDSFRVLCPSCDLRVRGEEEGEVQVRHGFCQHLRPGPYLEDGWERRWGDGAVTGWPFFEMLERPHGSGEAEFVVLAPFVLRRPIRIRGKMVSY